MFITAVPTTPHGTACTMVHPIALMEMSAIVSATIQLFQKSTIPKTYDRLPGAHRTTKMPDL